MPSARSHARVLVLLVSRVPLVLVAALACVIASSAGCSSAKKRETASLVAAFDRFQRAENAQRPAAAPAIAAVAVTDPEVRQVQGTCVSAVDATARALTLKSEVERGLDDLQRGRITQAQASQRNLDEKLALATRLLEDGRTRMPVCEEQLTALKQSVGL